MAELEEREAEKERRRAAIAQAELDEIRARPRSPLTLADLLGRPTLTPAGATRMIADVGGTIEARDGALVIAIADAFPEREKVVDAARVLYACAPAVLAALEHKSKRPLHERLPDEPALAR